MPDQFHAKEVWAILYEDADREPEIFTGETAEEAARKTFADRHLSWNCYLLSTAHVFNDVSLRQLLKDRERLRFLESIFPPSAIEAAMAKCRKAVQP